jgi:hypothetical protein
LNAQRVSEPYRRVYSLDNKRLEKYMTITVRSSDIGELAQNPQLVTQPHTATVVAGTGAFVAPIALLREIAGAPDAVRQLTDIVEALTEQEQRYAMAILSSEITGIENTLWFIPAPEGPHGPRIKVAIDPPRTIRPGGQEATVPFDEKKSSGGPVSPLLEQQVRRFIALNKEVLLDYWHLRIATDVFIARLRRIDGVA